MKDISESRGFTKGCERRKEGGRKERKVVFVLLFRYSVAVAMGDSGKRRTEYSSGKHSC